MPTRRSAAAPITTHAQAVQDCVGAVLDTVPAAMDALESFGFNLVSLSNNHAWDLKLPGIENTLQEASRLKLAHAGTGNNIAEAVAPAYLHTPKGTVALVAMASGLIEAGGSATATRPGVNELRVENGKPNEEDTGRILQSIRDAKKQADLVIVYEHNHVFGKPFQTIMLEELPERLGPPDWLKKWTHAEIDAGADIVVMHGAPLLHGVEIYHGRPIFFDLGNFIFQAPPIDILLDEPINWESVVAYVEFEGKNLRSIQLRPVAMNKIGQGQADTVAKYHIKDLGTLRTESDAHAELLCPTGDGEREQAVKANARQQERHRGKGSQDAHLNLAWGGVLVDDVGQCAHIRDGLRRVGAGDDLAEGWSQSGRIPRRPDHQVFRSVVREGSVPCLPV